MVLSMDNNCSATSFDMELCAEKLKSLGVQVSSSCVISPEDPVGVNASWISIVCICTRITGSFSFFLVRASLVSVQLQSVPHGLQVNCNDLGLNLQEETHST